MNNLSSKIAVVSEASKGIIAANAKQLAAESAVLVTNYGSGKPRADTAANELVASGGQAFAIRAEYAKEDDVTVSSMRLCVVMAIPTF